MKLVEKGHGFINEEEIPQWDGSWETFCPFAPYNKPQRFTIERKKGDKIISGAGGTSATWYNYQKLIIISENLGNLIILSTPLQLTFIRTVLSQN